MDELRRVVLARAGATGVAVAALAAGVLKPGQAQAAEWNADAFHAKSAHDALAKIDASNAFESKQVTLDAPQIAENGAVVPVEVTSSVPGTRAIYVLVDKNPFPLAGFFQFKEGAVPYVKLNVKMGESSFVRAIVEAGGKHYSASKQVKVTIGGCGG